MPSSLVPAPFLTGVDGLSVTGAETPGEGASRIAVEDRIRAGAHCRRGTGELLAMGTDPRRCSEHQVPI